MYGVVVKLQSRVDSLAFIYRKCLVYLAGSRPGGLVVWAWAALVSTGEDGYGQTAKKIVQAATKIAKRIEQMPNLVLMTPRPTVLVVCFGSNDFDIYNIKGDLSEMGWKLNALQSPAGINICIMENLIPHVDHFLHDLEAVVQRIRISEMDKSLCHFIDASMTS